MWRLADREGRQLESSEAPLVKAHSSSLSFGYLRGKEWKAWKAQSKKIERWLWRILFIYVTVKSFQPEETQEPWATQTNRWNNPHTVSDTDQEQHERTFLLHSTENMTCDLLTWSPTTNFNYQIFTEKMLISIQQNKSIIICLWFSFKCMRGNQNWILLVPFR